jgi:hypothetical protein
MSRTEGTLVRHPDSGAGLRDHEGTLMEVIWPTDYIARNDGGRLAVIDGIGAVIAHEGDLVEIAGAEVEPGAFLGCGGMRILGG